MEVRRTAKKKNFSEAEIAAITTGVKRNKSVLFGTLQTGIRVRHKQAVWKEIAAAVNSIGVDNRSPAEVKKKWSDLKVLTKKHFAALKCNSTVIGETLPEVKLTPTEERVARLIGYHVVPSKREDPDEPEEKPGTSDHPSDVQSSQQSPPHGTATTSSERGKSSAHRPAPPPPSLNLSAELLEKQAEMCQTLAEMNRSLLAINDTLKEINENLKYAMDK